jgi:hypothetical protein
MSLDDILPQLMGCDYKPPAPRTTAQEARARWREKNRKHIRAYNKRWRDKQRALYGKTT